MGIVIGAKPDRSFADPLGLLSDCHRRIEKFLETLILIVTDARSNTTPDGCFALADDSKHPLEVALKYFREAAPRHTRDEEESLFPKLRASTNGAARAALAAVDALEADHDRADLGHVEVERIGQQWLADGRITGGDIDTMQTVLSELQSLYQAHIVIEDTKIFPMAALVLDEVTIAGVGREMAERRGINLDTAPDLKLRCPTQRRKELLNVS
ncbi:MAG TPA: hemerythrin domain-containing protein [Capsulimonadaceae bacterium]|jgi:hypothetical protein